MIRIQRKRSLGWRMPPNAVYAGRPTVWGNPYNVAEMGLSEALRRYELWLDEKIKNNSDFLKPLYGKDLACWCPLANPCHVDVLIRKTKRCCLTCKFGHDFTLHLRRCFCDALYERVKTVGDCDFWKPAN